MPIRTHRGSGLPSAFCLRRPLPLIGTAPICIFRALQTVTRRFIAGAIDHRDGEGCSWLRLDTHLPIRIAYC
jgi:hypothetical protein